MTTTAGTYFYHHDGMGSVTDVTDAAGAQQVEYRYEAFGDLRQHQQHTAGAPANLLRYTGEYYDEFTGTYHLRARQYDTHLGRFTQTDPLPANISDPFVASYVYVGNMPTTVVDPSGMFIDELLGLYFTAETLVEFAEAAAAGDTAAMEEILLEWIAGEGIELACETAALLLGVATSGIVGVLVGVGCTLLAEELAPELV